MHSEGLVGAFGLEVAFDWLDAPLVARRNMRTRS